MMPAPPSARALRSPTDKRNSSDTTAVRSGLLDAAISSSREMLTACPGKCCDTGERKGARRRRLGDALRRAILRPGGQLGPSSMDVALAKDGKAVRICLGMDTAHT